MNGKPTRAAVPARNALGMMVKHAEEHDEENKNRQPGEIIGDREGNHEDKINFPMRIS